MSSVTAPVGYTPLQNDQIAMSQQVGPPTVIVQQPMAYSTTTTVISQQPEPAKRDWQSGMCNCFDDINSCCCVLFCGNFYIGSMASRMGEHYCVGCCLPGIWPMRSVLRTRHNISGDMCNDFCTLAFCGMCATCQMAREMNLLGYPKNC